MKLGKLEARHDTRTLMLARYTAALPPPPDAVDWGGKLRHLGMMANDRLGDCTCASIGHMIQVWTSQTTEEVVLTDEVIVALYEQSCGYSPTEPSSDRGGVELDVLNYWRKNPVEGHELGAFCAVEPRSVNDVKDAIALFGGAYVGIALPRSAQGKSVWTVPTFGPRGAGAPGSWGGHAVPIIAYDVRGLTCITWGKPLRMTWEFLKAYCDEAYALVSPDWINHTGMAPSGFDLATLNADLASITKG